MATTKLKTIKENIKYILESLKRQEIIKDVQVDDFKSSIFTREFSSFPVAILTTPTTESRADTNVSNLRTYQFEILFILKADDVSDPAEVEDLLELILNQFDNDPTLKGGGNIGAADGAVEPSSNPPGVVVSGDQTYIAFSITIRVKATRDLTFV